jgi:hypothetical protein
MAYQTSSTVDRALPRAGGKISSSEIRTLFDQAGDDVDELFRRTSNTITVEAMGGIGDSLSHPASAALGVSTLAELHAYNDGIYAFADSISNEMDWLAIQAGLNAGGRLTCREGAHFIVNKTLRYINGLGSWVDLPPNAILDFRGMLPDASSTNLIVNGTFASGASWANTTLLHTDVVFGSGFATFTDPTPGTGPSFGQFGQEVTIPPGKWRVRADVTVTNGASAGLYGLPYVGMGFFGVGVGLGGSSITKSINRSSSFTGSEEIYFDFEVTTTTVAWLTFQGGNGNFTVANVKIQPFFLNCAVWSTADGADAGVSSGINGIWRGGWFWGPNQDGGIACFLVKSFTTLERQLHLFDAHIGARGTIDVGGTNAGFTGGVVYSDIAFLCSINNCTIGYSRPGVQFLPGSQNAGENMRINDTVIYNGWTCLDVRGGGEWNLCGVSMDYSNQFVTAARGALVNATNCHFEASPSALPMFELEGGACFVMANGELFQGGSDPCTAQTYITLGDSNCKFLMGDVWLFNARTASGTWASGPGLVRANNFAVGGGNTLLPAMILRNFQMDAFASNGGMQDLGGIGFYGTPADGIGFRADLYADSGTPTSRMVIPSVAQATRDTGVARNGAGSIKIERLGTYTQGIGLSVYYPVTEGKIAFDEFAIGQQLSLAAFNAGAPSALSGAITTTAGSNIAEFRDDSAQYLNGSGPRPGWQAVISGATAVGGVAAGSINGTRTIIARTDWNKWTVALGATAATSATGGGAGISVQYKQTSVRIFNRRFWVKLDGFDAYGRSLRTQVLFAGEVDIDIPLTGPNWILNQMSSWYSEGVAPVDLSTRYGTGRAPIWATHMMIQLDVQNIIPAGVSAGTPIPVYVTDFYANLI